MYISFEKPLSGKPRTVESRDRSGNPKFTITPNELTPTRAKIFDALHKGLLVALILAAVVDVLNRGDINEAFFTDAAFPLLAAYFAASWTLRWLLGKSTKIVMTVNAISVWRWFGWQRFDRNLVHSFVLLPHDLQNQEAERIHYQVQEAAERGKRLKPKYYYRDTCHVVLAHAGHRRDLLVVYGEKEAHAVLARLQFCDLLLDEAMNIGRGAGQTPADEWKKAPGGFHE